MYYEKVCECSHAKPYSANNQLSKALVYRGEQSRVDQRSAAAESMIAIARLLAQAQDLSAFDISKWFREYEGPPEAAQLILSQDMAQYYVCSADESAPALASILHLYAKDSESYRIG